MTWREVCLSLDVEVESTELELCCADLVLRTTEFLLCGAEMIKK